MVARREILHQQFRRLVEKEEREVPRQLGEENGLVRVLLVRHLN
jgi:hypothetical protein